MFLLVLNVFVVIISKNCHASFLDDNFIGGASTVAFVGHSCRDKYEYLITKSYSVAKRTRKPRCTESRRPPREGITSRNLFSFNLNNNGGKNEKEEEVNFGTAAVKDKMNVGESNSPLPWVAKNLMIIDRRQGMTRKSKEMVNGSIGDMNNVGIDYSFDKNGSNVTDNNSNRIPSNSFPLASIINVEALLMASGKIPLEEAESDPGTALLMDMISESGRQSVINSSTRNDLGESTTTNGIELSWDAFLGNIRQSVKEVADKNALNGALGPRSDLSISTDYVLNQAIQGIESFLNDAAASFSQERVQNLILAATRSLAVDQSADVLKSAIDNIVATAENLAREQGVDVSEAAAQARATTKYTTEFLRVANGVLLSGYVQGGEFRKQLQEEVAKEMNISLSQSKMMSKPLFHRFSSVQSIPEEDYNHVARKGVEMAKLAGAIYQDTIPTIHELRHALVANGTSADVAWMVTDSIGYDDDFKIASSDFKGNPMLIRTIIIRGFDASDEKVDRERLVQRICNARSVPLSSKFKNIMVHEGLLEVARIVYKDIKPFIDLAGTTHKIVLNGHSIGGALSNLILMIVTAEYGVVVAQEKFIRIYTFGSPPVAVSNNYVLESPKECSILQELGLPSDMVYGYIKPWDPIVRLFSPIDPMYPLIEDLGEDGLTLYATGPPRTLRPVTRAILESWESWPTFRDNNRPVMKQNYRSIGLQHLLMPDPGRYLTDRLITVNVNAYPVDEVLRISPEQLYDALEEAFPLDVFSISLVPTAIRSFIHHFFPAYTQGFEAYTTKEEEKKKKNK